VIDSGIHVNADLSSGLLSSVWWNQSFVPGEDADDYYGHGTHVAGIIAGRGTNSAGSGYLFQIHGVAPAAHLINLKVLDRNGRSTDAAVISAIDTAIALKGCSTSR
jgi:serine protease AprX